MSDLRLAIRSLLKHPGFSAVVVLTLALGIGANTAIFSLLDGVMFTPLNVANADELFLLQRATPIGIDPQFGTGSFARFSYPQFERMAEALPTGTSLAAMSRVALMNARVGTQNRALRVRSQLVSGGYFRTFSPTAAFGRLLGDGDNLRIDGHTVAVVSYEFWQQHLGASPSVVGEPLVVNAVPMTIVGVAARGFNGVWVDSPTDVWLPAAMQQALGYRQNFGASFGNVNEPWLHREDITWLSVVARAPRDRQPALTAAVDTATRRMAAAIAQQTADPAARARILATRMLLVPFARGLSGLRAQFALPLYLLTAMAAMVLLITCVNIANMLLAKGMARSTEIGIRLSLGASRMRLVRQLLAESAVLSFTGGTLGVGVGVWTSAVLASIALPSPYALNMRVLIFSVGLSCLTTILFGLTPALRSTRPSAVRAVAGTPKGAPAQGWRVGMRPLLAVQLALAFVLTVGAVLFGRSLVNLTRIDPGFDAEHVISVWFNPESSGYAADAIPALKQRLRATALATPGVISASHSWCALADGCRNANTGNQIEGYQPPPGETVTLQFTDVDAHYFQTTGMPIVEGRGFDEREGPDDLVAVVNEATARHYFPGRSPLGGRFSVSRFSVRIVGVVRDARTNDIAEAPVPTVFFPLGPAAARVLQVRVAGDPGSVLRDLQRHIAQAEPGLTLERASTIGDQIGRNVTRQRLVAYITVAFGALALVMACLGLYGAVSYAVSQRTAEFGVRIAVGARPSDVLRLVMGDGLRVAVIGIVLGLITAVAAGRLARALLFGITPSDAGTYLAVIGALLAAATLATGIPARRAARVDPMTALRTE